MRERHYNQGISSSVVGLEANQYYSKNLSDEEPCSIMLGIISLHFLFFCKAGVYWFRSLSQMKPSRDYSREIIDQNLSKHP